MSAEDRKEHIGSNALTKDDLAHSEEYRPPLHRSNLLEDEKSEEAKERNKLGPSREPTVEAQRAERRTTGVTQSEPVGEKGASLCFLRMPGLIKHGRGPRTDDMKSAFHAN